MNINCLLKFLPVILLTTTYTIFGMEGKKTIIENNKISDHAHVNNIVNNNNSQTIHISNNNISNNASVINNISQQNNPIIFFVPMFYIPNMPLNYTCNTPYVNQQSTIPVNYNKISSGEVMQTNLDTKGSQANSHYEVMQTSSGYEVAHTNPQYQKSYKSDDINIKKKENNKQYNSKINNEVNNKTIQKYTPLNINVINT